MAFGFAICNLAIGLGWDIVMGTGFGSLMDRHLKKDNNQAASEVKNSLIIEIKNSLQQIRRK
jgi:hypothetical protein